MGNIPDLPAGSNISFCIGCSELFNSVSSFDAHQVGHYGAPSERQPISPVRCLTPDEMLARGMSKNDAGRWILKPYNNWHQDALPLEASDAAIARARAAGGQES